MSKRGIAATFAMIVWGIAPAAHADAVAEKPTAEAQAAWREGLAAYDRGEFERACVEFEKTYALTHRWNVLANLAKAELKLGRPLDALKHLRFALEDPRAQSEAGVGKDLDRAYAATGHMLVGAPDRVALAVDDVDVGIAPLPHVVDVMPGLHGIAARKNEVAWRTTVDAPAGSVVQVNMGETEPREAPVVATRAVAPPSLLPIDMPPLEKRNTHESSARWLVSGGLVLLGIGTAAVGGGVLIGASSDRDRETAAGQSAPGGVCAATAAGSCADLASRASGARAGENLGRALLIAGGASAAIGAIAFVLWPKGSLRVAPQVGLGAASLVAQGQF